MVLFNRVMRCICRALVAALYAVPLSMCAYATWSAPSQADSTAAFLYSLPLWLLAIACHAELSDGE